MRRKCCDDVIRDDNKFHYKYFICTECNKSIMRFGKGDYKLSIISKIKNMIRGEV